jgi:hypothetical protein
MSRRVYGAVDHWALTSASHRSPPATTRAAAVAKPGDGGRAALHLPVAAASALTLDMFASCSPG